MESRANTPVASPPWVAMRPIHRSLLLLLLLLIAFQYFRIVIILPTIPGYSENLPDYSRIFPDSFNHLLCSKLCRHNRRMPMFLFCPTKGCHI